MTYHPSSRLNKGQKLVRLIEWMQRRGGIRVHEVEALLDVDPRTFRRYLTDLRDLGLPVKEEGRGAQRVVSLDPAYRRSGVQLTLGEMISLRFGRALFDFLDGTGFAADIDQAIDRLEPTVSRANADVVRDFDGMFMAVPEHAKDYSAGHEIIDEILSALIYCNPGQASYRPARGEERKYLIEPFTLATYRQGLYLFARDVDEDRVKTFAVERFRSFYRIRKQKFSRPNDWDPRAFVADAFGITAGSPRAIVVRFSPRVAEFIKERRWHGSQGLQPRPDGSIEVLLRCAITPELRQWILGYGADAEVLEPQELRDEIRETLLSACRRYQSPADTTPTATTGTLFG